MREALPRTAYFLGKLEGLIYRGEVHKLWNFIRDVLPELSRNVNKVEYRIQHRDWASVVCPENPISEWGWLCCSDSVFFFGVRRGGGSAPARPGIRAYESTSIRPSEPPPPSDRPLFWEQKRQKAIENIRGSQGPRKTKGNIEQLGKNKILLVCSWFSIFLWFSTIFPALGPRSSWGRSLVRPPYLKISVWAIILASLRRHHGQGWFFFDAPIGGPTTIWPPWGKKGIPLPRNRPRRTKLTKYARKWCFARRKCLEIVETSSELFKQI